MKRFVFPGLVLCLAIAFVLLLNGTWMKWGDPVVDTGRELEIACKVADGKVLYRDMAYNYGPFSPWVNALFVRLFGPELTSFALSGIVSSLLGMLLVFMTARVFLGKRLSCCLAGLFLFECVFQHYYFNGNFSFILPYSYPAVHAMLAALGAFIFLARHLDKNGNRNNKGSWPLVGAGICMGICFLCKIEIAGAVAVPVALIPALTGFRSGLGIKQILRHALSWAVPLCVVAVGGFLPYFIHASMSTVLWENVLKPQLIDFTSNVFFMQHLGLSHLGFNLQLMGLSLLMWAVFLLALIVFSIQFKGKGANVAAKGLTGLCVVAAFIWLWIDLTWEIEFRGLPVLIIVTVPIVLFSMLFNKKENLAQQGKLLALALFAGLSLMRIFLTAGTFHYGFCLALPGVIFFVVLLMRFVPERLPERIRPHRSYAYVLAGALLLLSGRSFFTASMDNFDDRTVLLEGTGGKMWVQPEPLGLDLYIITDLLKELARPGDTMLVLPEGVFLNFLLGLPNPTYYNLFIPPELDPETEKKVIEQIEANEVEWIALLNRPVWEFGSRGLGNDYGMDLMAHVKKQYKREFSSGPEPYASPESGGAVLYRRKKDKTGSRE